MRINLLFSALLLLMMSGCSVHHWLSESGGKSGHNAYATPDGMTISFQCQQSNILDFLSFDYEACHPVVAPTWSHEPGEETRQQERSEF